MSKRLLVLLLILLFAAAGAGAYYFFRPQISDLIDRLTGAVKEEEGGEEETPCTGETYTNTRQGYRVCYPSGWDTQAFGYSQLSVGFDPFPIPEASEYGGIFMISVRRDSSAAILADYLGSLEGAATAAETLDGVAGIRVTGTLPADHVFFPDYYQIAVVLENFSRTYAIAFLSSPDGYETNLALFEEFLAGFDFIEGTGSPPWGQDIWLNSPWPGDTVSCSFSLAGSAQGAFESTLGFTLKNAAGTALVEDSLIYNAPDAGELGYFDTTLSFSTTSPSGTLEVFHTSPMDGSIADLVSVPLTFETCP